MSRNADGPNNHRAPYGRAPFLLGLHAFDALHDLCDVPSEGEPRWVDSDLLALHGWFSVEEYAPPAQVEVLDKTDHAERLAGLLRVYRLALPFDEAERYWLHDVYAAAWGPTSVETIRVQETEIVSSGLRRKIGGDDVLRRWSAWRRKADQFSKDGTVDIAREALRELVQTTAPDLELPETYRSLDGG